MTDPMDLLDISTVLTAEERDIQATVARFLDDHVRPNIASWFAEGIFPRGQPGGGHANRGCG